MTDANDTNDSSRDLVNDELPVDEVKPEDASYEAYVAAHSPQPTDSGREVPSALDNVSESDSRDDETPQSDVLPVIDDEVPVLIEWGIVGLKDAEGEVYSRSALRKNPPMLILYAEETPFASVDLTPQVTARLMASLKQVKQGYTGESDLPPKTFSDRVHGAIGWGLKHKIRGAFALIILLSMTYSVLAGAGILAFRS